MLFSFSFTKALPSVAISFAMIKKYPILSSSPILMNSWLVILFHTNSFSSAPFVHSLPPPTERRATVKRWFFRSFAHRRHLRRTVIGSWNVPDRAHVAPREDSTLLCFTSKAHIEARLDGPMETQPGIAAPHGSSRRQLGNQDLDINQSATRLNGLNE